SVTARCGGGNVYRAAVVVSGVVALLGVLAMREVNANGLLVLVEDDPDSLNQLHAHRTTLTSRPTAIKRIKVTGTARIPPRIFEDSGRFLRSLTVCFSLMMTACG